MNCTSDTETTAIINCTAIKFLLDLIPLNSSLPANYTNSTMLEPDDWHLNFR